MVAVKSGVEYMDIGPRLSNYWNIYWILIGSLTIGRIYGIFLRVLNLVKGELGHKRGAEWCFGGACDES